MDRIKASLSRKSTEGDKVRGASSSQQRCGCRTVQNARRWIPYHRNPFTVQGDAGQKRYKPNMGGTSGEAPRSSARVMQRSCQAQQGVQRSLLCDAGPNQANAVPSAVSYRPALDKIFV